MTESNQNRPSDQSLPPLPHERGGSLGATDVNPWLPTMVSVGVGLAALLLVEKSTKGVSRATSRTARGAGRWSREAYHDAEDWLTDAADDAGHWAHDAYRSASHWGESLGDGLIAAGAKAAGIAGLLKMVGGGQMRTGTRRAMKAMALKKLAEFTTRGTKRATKRTGKFVARHPMFSAGAGAGAVKARAGLHEGRERVRDAYEVLRGGRQALRKEESHAGSMMLALGVIGVGAAAAWYVSANSGRTEQLRQRVAERAQQMREQMRGRMSGTGAGGAANDEQLVSRVRREIADKVSGDLSDLRVASSDGRVTLTGNLTQEQRNQATRIAREVAGVRDVDVIDTSTTAG